MGLFRELYVYYDRAARSAALHMAIDEALLETARVPSLRFYGWANPALSFGYFGRFADVAKEQTRRDLVRRWTGGGIVLHETDLTYSLIIPASDPSFSYSARRIYSEVHAAIRDVLGETARLAETAAPRISEACFANPVTADVIWNGEKVAGAAQRRTRSALLQQGSIQHPPLPEDFTEQLARALSPRVQHEGFTVDLLARAEEIALQKYATPQWLHRR